MVEALRMQERVCQLTKMMYRKDSAQFQSEVVTLLGEYLVVVRFFLSSLVRERLLLLLLLFPLVVVLSFLSL